MVSGQSPPRKIAPWLGLGFGLELGLKLGLGVGQFSSWVIVPEPFVIYCLDYIQFINKFCLEGSEKI